MYNVEKNDVKFKDSFIYNPYMGDGHLFKFFKLEYAFGGNAPYGETTNGKWEGRVVPVRITHEMASFILQVGSVSGTHHA